MNDIWSEVKNRLSSGDKVVMVTIVAHSGSTPRRSGAKMVVSSTGTSVGTIGGGPVEAEVIEKAQDVFSSKNAVILDYSFSTSTSAASMDLICGGRFKVLVEYLEPSEQTLQMVEAITDAIQAGKGAMRLCRLTDSQNGRGMDIEYAVMLADQTWLPPSLYDAGLREIMAENDDGWQKTKLIEKGNQHYLLEPILLQETVYILGGGHVAKEIAPLLHKAAFQTVVMDDRPEFANVTRFPGSLKVVVSPGYSQVFADLVPDATSSIIIVTRGHSHDKKCLGQALRTKAGYIGMIGSRSKREQIYRILLDEGFSAGELERVHCPIGLAIGGETPFEIAVSIVAEIILHRARRKGGMRC